MLPIINLPVTSWGYTNGQPLWAFESPKVSRVIETLDADNVPSQAVVRKCRATLGESDEELLVLVIERSARARGVRTGLSAEGAHP